jgi:hypothetical protein
MSAPLGADFINEGSVESEPTLDPNLGKSTEHMHGYGCTALPFLLDACPAPCSPFPLAAVHDEWLSIAPVVAPPEADLLVSLFMSSTLVPAAWPLPGVSLDSRPLAPSHFVLNALLVGWLASHPPQACGGGQGDSAATLGSRGGSVTFAWRRVLLGLELVILKGRGIPCYVLCLRLYTIRVHHTPNSIAMSLPFFDPGLDACAGQAGHLR